MKASGAKSGPCVRPAPEGHEGQGGAAEVVESSKLVGVESARLSAKDLDRDLKSL